jgi:hypothetical protein
VFDWLELSLQNNLPSSLLILSRAFLITHAKEEDTQTATLKDITDTLASLPEEVVTQVSVETLKDITDTLASLPEEVVTQVSVVRHRRLDGDLRDHFFR